MADKCQHQYKSYNMQDPKQNCLINSDEYKLLDMKPK